MSTSFQNTGETLALQALVNKASLGDLKYHLFVNNATISETTVLGDLTEASGTGYAAKTLTGASWTVSGGQATYADQVVTVTTAETYYGGYVTDNAGTGLLVAEKFGSAVVGGSGGAVITMQPKITTSNGITEGLATKISLVVNKTAQADLKLKIFKSNTTIANTTILSDLTEANEAGYASKTLTGASWTVTNSQASYAEQTFSISTSGTFYGYYIVDSGSTKIIAAGNFAQPIVFGNGGGDIKVTPIITAE